MSRYNQFRLVSEAGSLRYTDTSLFIVSFPVSPVHYRSSLKPKTKHCIHGDNDGGAALVKPLLQGFFFILSDLKN